MQINIRIQAVRLSHRGSCRGDAILVRMGSIHNRVAGHPTWATGARGARPRAEQWRCLRSSVWVGHLLSPILSKAELWAGYSVGRYEVHECSDGISWGLGVGHLPLERW